MIDPVGSNRAPARSANRPAAGQAAELLIALLLVVGFFVGPLKLLGDSWVSYLGADSLAVLILLMVAADRLIKRAPLIAASPLSIPLVSLIVLCVLELANPEAPFIRSILGLRSWLLYPLLYFVGLYFFRSVSQLRKLYALLVVLGILTSAYGIYQWKMGPQAFATWSDQYGRYARVMWSSTGSVSVFRAFSTFVLPNTFGENMALVMILAFSVAASPGVARWWRLLAGAAFGVMAVGIAASGTRAPVVHLLSAIGIGVLLIGSSGRRLKLVCTAALLTAAGIALVAFIIGPLVSARFLTVLDSESFFWKWFLPLGEGLRIAREHPFGMGLGYTAGVPHMLTTPVFQDLPVTTLDSGYGSAAAELGFVGFAVFGYLAVKVGIEGIRTWRSLTPGALRDLLLGPALLAVTYPVVSVIAQPQATLPSTIYLWLLVGMLMKAPALQKELNADKLPPHEMHAR